MTIDASKIAKVKTAMDNRYEKKVNKKTTISGSYTNDNDSYPTILACLNKFGELVTSWSVTSSDTKYPSEKLVKTELDKKIDKSNTVGLVKNDGTIDTNTYLTQHQSLANYIQTSSTVGLVKNDGTITTHQDISGKVDISQGSTNKNLNVVTDSSGDITLEAKPTIPSKTSDLTNDGDGTNAFVKNNDSRLSDARTPTSHTHGNVSNDGKVGTTSGKPLITGTSGAITTGDFGTTSGTFAEGNHNHDTAYADISHSHTKSEITDFPSEMTPSSHTHGDITNDGKLGSTANKPLITTTGGKITTGAFGTSANQFAEGNHTHSQYLTSHQSLNDIGGTVTVEKQATAETGYTATYVIKQGGSALSPKINIPKDYLVKSASLETVGSTPTSTETSNSLTTGDKYLKFTVNTQENDDSTVLVIPVNDLIDTYTADNSTLQVSNNQFSVKSGGITTTQLASGVVTSLGYADDYHSSPASSITSTQVSNWDSMASGGTTINDVDSEINQALDDLAEAIYPTSGS